MGGSVVEDHQDTASEALRCTILLQLVHQGSLAVHLENVTYHPTTGTGVLMDRQAASVIATECTRVVSMVHHDRLKFAVFGQVSPLQEDETVLECFETQDRLLFPSDVRPFRHLLPLQACFIHVEDLQGLVHPLLDDGLETD